MSMQPHEKSKLEGVRSDEKFSSEATTLRHCLGNPYTHEAWTEAIKRSVETGQFNFDDAMFENTVYVSRFDEDISYHAEIQLPDHMVSSSEIIQKIRKAQEAAKKRSEKSTHRRHEEAFTAGPKRSF